MTKRLCIISILVLLWADAAFGQLAGSLTAPAPAMQASSERIAPNDNRRPAGVLANEVLTVNLEARSGLWYPDGPDGLARNVAAFAEAGGPLQDPGPLIRVPAGTEVRVTVRNALDEVLTMFGLGVTRGVAGDSVRIEPGATREVRFTLAEPGTYYYTGKTTPVTVFARRGRDSQLNGAIVVDPPGTGGPARDRVFVISAVLEADTSVPSGAALGNVLAINGLSWPHTERIHVTQGDSLYWRWVTVTPPPHPMHLHGSYFRVDARGDGARDTIYARDARRLAVTEVLRQGQTMKIAWSPQHPGNWIFHCHIAAHMTPVSVLRQIGMPAASRVAHNAPGTMEEHAMARLVLGIQVEPRGEVARSTREPRRIRLVVRSRADATGLGEGPRYAYVLGSSPEDADSAALRVPGPTLVLEKDQPVAITIVNRSHEPAAVHWHGIELESFPDGVPGWSGAGASILPAIAVGDSLTVRFTPPRAGTFMYHSHFNEHQQIAQGLYGAIVVLEPGRRLDPETDRVWLFSDERETVNTVRGPFARPLLNGTLEPEPLQLRVGVTYRFRLINIRSDYSVAAALLDGDRPVEWRHVAKDGADLPAAQVTLRPAQLLLSVGEIYDFEFTPRTVGELTLQFGYPPGFRVAGVSVPAPTRVAVHVRAGDEGKRN
ncbi:MAG TPA: multicopper oxidase domain-containing protein [Gemmatimonadales bacterium]|nr:multicopper oxidase domain-containing protein [Gemmatimonadales bacterium]